LILSIAILSILSIYWGVLFHVEQNLSSLVVWVVDFDAQVAPYTDTTPIVGPEIVKAAEALIAPEGALGWGSLPASDFGYDPMEVRRRVWEFGAWAVSCVVSFFCVLMGCVECTDCRSSCQQCEKRECWSHLGHWSGIEHSDYLGQHNDAEQLTPGRSSFRVSICL